ncbi:SGNH/GDSL hydrolase family protein [Larkinella sp. GY13]|uniref:SGNH/GDSL hydrolase family protein n=1 Tax=Larkinella sp. GY13 TaxID=3453720 RepID=UPI003EEAEF0D
MTLFFLFLLLACAQPGADDDRMTPKPGASTDANYLALGDSYTIGESVPEADRWSVLLAGLLRKDGLTITDPDIIARTGWTTSELSDAIKQSGNQKTYQLVSLLIGVNNQYRGQDVERYRMEFRALLQTATRFAGGKPGRVFVLSIPDWGVTPYAAGSGRDRQQIAKEIDAFNDVALDECKKAGIVYVDITPTSRTAAGDPSQIAEDRLHFSGKQYRQWAEKALPVVKKLL